MRKLTLGIWSIVRFLIEPFNVSRKLLISPSPFRFSCVPLYYSALFDLLFPMLRKFALHRTFDRGFMLAGRIWTLLACRACICGTSACTYTLLQADCMTEFTLLLFSWLFCPIVSYTNSIKIYYVFIKRFQYYELYILSYLFTVVINGW